MLYHKYRPIEVSSYAIWGGSLALLPFGTGFIEQIPTAGLSETAAVVYLGIFPAAVANLCWSSVLKIIPAARAASFLYSVPVVTLCIGFLLLKEMPPPVSLAGGAMAIGGVFFANSKVTVRGIIHKPRAQKGES